MKKHFLSFIVCIVLFASCDTNEPTNKKDNGIGKFSISESKQVTFSPGNLQYHPANNEWRFAKSQLDYIGEENWNISSTYYGWIDLFGWSGDTCVVKFGVSASTSHTDYRGSFVDWGTNQIGDDAPNTWRTLTRDEWYYLRSTRANADNLIGVAQVNGVNGLILLPDKWKCPAGVSFKSGFCSKSADDGDYAIHQTFSSEQWSILELSGAIFLPAAGKRGYAKEYSLHRWGAYWSSSHDFTELAQAFSFYNDGTSIGYDGDTTTGRSVRLVKDL